MALYKKTAAVVNLANSERMPFCGGRQWPWPSLLKRTGHQEPMPLSRQPRSGGSHQRQMYEWIPVWSSG